MEYRVPVTRRLDSDTDNGANTTWVHCRVDRTRGSDGATTTKVTVENNPFFTLVIQPWAEGASITSSSPPGAFPSITSGSLDGHLRWIFTGKTANTTAVELELDFTGREAFDGGSNFDGRLEIYCGQGRNRKEMSTHEDPHPPHLTTASRARASRASSAPTTRYAYSLAFSTGASHHARGQAE